MVLSSLVVLSCLGAVAPILVGQVGGSANAVERDAANGQLCLAVGPRVLLVDGSDPADPRLVGQTEVLDDVVTAVACDGGRIVAGGSRGSLWGIDAGDPAAPQVLWKTSLATRVADVALVGPTLYVVAGAALRAFDTSEPVQPRVLGERSLPRSGTAVVADDVLVAVTWGAGRTGGLLLLGADAPLDGEPLAELQLSDAVQDVALVGALAYVLEKNAMRVVDLARPDAPEIIGSVTHEDWQATPYANRLAIEDGFAYLAVGMVGGVAWDDIASDGGAEIVDVREPRRPRVVGHYDLSPGDFGNGCADVAVGAGHAWALDPAMGLTALDVAKPEAPRAVGGFETGGAAFDVAVHDDRAFLAGGWGTRELDIGDPATPRTVGYEPSVGAQTLVEVADETLFASVYGFFVNGTWWRPLQGTALGGHLDVAVADIAFGDGIAYLAGARPAPRNLGGLDVYDLRDAARPVRLAAPPLLPAEPGEAVGLQGDTVFVTAGETLHRFDVSRPSDPVEVGLPIASAAARRLVVWGERVVVAGEGLAVVDASDPTALRLLGTLPAASGSRPAADLAVDGATGFVLTADRLDVVDLDDPAHPWARASVVVPFPAAAMDLTPTHLYVACGSAGMLVYSRAAGPEPSPTAPTPPEETSTPTGPLPRSTAYLPFAARGTCLPPECPQPTQEEGLSRQAAAALR